MTLGALAVFFALLAVTAAVSWLVSRRPLFEPLATFFGALAALLGATALSDTQISRTWAIAIIIVGADFCFGYGNEFHSYATQYDNYNGHGIGNVVAAVDVFGNRRLTWPSYLNFKCWMDNLACTIPGTYINCSEGIMGAYREGNIQQFKYMPLHDALIPYQSADRVYLEEKGADGKTIQRNPLNLDEYFGNSQYDHNLTLF